MHRRGGVHLRVATSEKPLVRAPEFDCPVYPRHLDRVLGVPPAAAFYAMPKVDLPDGRTDEEFVLGLLHQTGILCVYGSGFGTDPTDGFFRIVFLASPSELDNYCDAITEFTVDFLAS